MSILVLADLHLDEIADRQHLVGLGEAIRTVGKDAELMIIAGDLTESAIQRWPTALHGQAARSLSPTMAPQPRWLVR